MAYLHHRCVREQAVVYEVPNFLKEKRNKKTIHFKGY
jgi:hypothetical protein